MTRNRRTILTALLLALAQLGAAAQSTSILIEGEAFQFKGKWVTEKSSDCLGSAMLRVYQDNRPTSATDDALTVVNITQSATYHVWTRSQDFANSPRPRTYTLSIDGHEMSPSGAHGIAGFYWEHVGQVELSRKAALMRLSDTGRYYGRCDAILLTTDASLNPNTLTNTELARSRRNPATMDFSTESAPQLTEPLNIASGYDVLATAANDSIRISFVRLGTDGPIVCKTDFYAAGSWRRYSSTAEDNRIALVSRPADDPATLNHNQFYPAWDPCVAARTLTFEGRDYPVIADGDNSNPYFAGTLTEARATAVTKTAANCIKVTYGCGNAGTLTAYWTVPESGRHIAVRMLFKPTADGYYSLALHGAKGIADAEACGGLMPPMFAGLRLPATPQMICSSMMSQCLSAIATESAFGTATAFVSADLDAFAQDWGGYDNSPIGFTLRNSRGELQPVAFAPVPAMADSHVKAGRTLEARFITGIQAGNWDDALEYVSTNVFSVSDYRTPGACSLSEAVANVTDLIRNDSFSGWEPRLKGFWDIEADGNTTPTVVQAAPLALIGAASLAHDEDLYLSRALPTIEYLLSRTGYRTRANQPAALTPEASQFPTTLFEGINSLTGGLNPWLEELALPKGETRAANGYFSTLQEFRQELAALRLTGDDSHLQRAEALANDYAAEILSDRLPDMAAGSFYNSQMIPDWTPLLDIYALTGNELHLQAAAHGAAHTLAGVKTWPKVAPGMQTVHPGNKFDGVTTIWWKGTEQFRLGFPRTEGDAPEHEVEAAKVSPVGLGMEQPATYFVRTAGKTVRPVFMNSWAPRLMELGALTGKEIFSTYGRNAVIGRADNYPGYYATGFTDLTMAENFPYAGPDVSSIYFHHIPAYLAMLQDCLVTEITTRSKGDISFEAARQEGFVWFANNIYGNSRGTIGGEPVRLFMPRGGVLTGNPAVNVLTARGENRLHIMLTNDGNADANVTLTLGQDLARRITAYNPDALSATVPARGLKVLTVDADFSDLPDPTPLTDGLDIIDTGSAAGSIYLYRIRSPFGHDSVYGFADCGEVAGLTVTAECNGAGQSASAWPYEWSFGTFACDEPAEVTVNIMIDGRTVSTVSKTFDPTQTSVPPVSVTGAGAAAGSAIYTPDGRRVSSMSRPGIYIVNGKKILKN